MFSRLKRMSRGGWITTGIILGAIIAPGVALAAFSDIRIVGVGGGPVAQVTPANQLRVAEMDASRHRRFHAFASGGGACINFPIPPGNSYMVKQVEFDVYGNASPGPSDTVYLYAASNCVDAVASSTPPGTGPIVIPFEPGIAIPSGGAVSVRVQSTGLDAEIYILGYLMQANAVPAPSTASAAASTPRPARPSPSGRPPAVRRAMQRGPADPAGPPPRYGRGALRSNRRGGLWGLT